MKLFLFLGPEEFRKREEMASILRKYKDLQSYHASSVDLEELHQLLLTPPLFGDIPPVLLTDIDLLSAKDQKRLAELCARSRGGSTTPFFLFSKEYKISAPMAKVFPKGEQRVFWELSESDKKKHINALVQKRGAKIEPGAIDLLLERVSSDLLTLDRSLETVLLYLNSEGDLISEDLLSRIFTEHRSGSVYDLFHYMVERDLVQSLQTAESLLLEGNNKAVSLFSQLLYQWDKLLQIKERMSLGSFEEVCNIEYVRSKALKADMRLGVANYQLHELHQIQKINQDYSLSLKLAAGLQALQFKHYVYQVVN